jgi:hypothetical protein
MNAAQAILLARQRAHEERGRRELVEALDKIARRQDAMEATLGRLLTRTAALGARLEALAAAILGGPPMGEDIVPAGGTCAE